MTLDEILQISTAAVAAPYFLLPIDGGDPVTRERVYCYELYHQMRSVWDAFDHPELILNGEVDKRKHLGMEALGVKNHKPDFLVHRPGDMEGNHAIIEVKPSNADSEDIRKDLSTLSIFRAGPHYERGLYLIYGEGANAQFVHRIIELAEQVEGTAGIEVWLHQQVGEPAYRTAILD